MKSERKRERESAGKRENDRKLPGIRQQNELRMNGVRKREKMVTGTIQTGKQESIIKD